MPGAELSPTSDEGPHASGAEQPGVGSPALDAAPVRGPRFDAPVVRGGYSWWYVDALSDDGKNGITLIALIGSVFSPYYAAMRRRRSAAIRCTMCR